MSKQPDRKVGVAFSGGGIRSAALCSGVLRRLLQTSTPIDYLSCVSGGGYIGASYLDWKFRNECKDDPFWHKEYFEHLRQHSNPICDCRNPCTGCFHALRIILLALFVSLIVPCASVFMYAIPNAYAFDYFFGDKLRASFVCPKGNDHNFTESQIKENPQIVQSLNISSSKTVECVPVFGVLMYDTISLFAILLAITISMFFLKTIFKRRSLFNVFNISSSVMVFVFCMVFLPWLIEEYIVVTPLWVNALIIVLSVVVWLGFPPLRSKASWILVIFFFAYTVKWRVYKTAILGIVYTQERFWVMLWISGMLLWLHPFLGSLQQNAVHLQNALMLQKTFFSPESRKSAKVNCADFVPWSTSCCQSKQEDINRPLTLGDLAHLKPEYMCNVAVNHWRKTNEQGEKNYELLVLSPSIIERIDRSQDEKQFDNEGFIQPSDVKLHTAMATSAAAVSYDFGRRSEGLQAVRDLQIVLGIGMGKSLVAQPGLSSQLPCVVRALPMIVQLLMAIPLLGIPVARYYGAPIYFDKIAIIMFLCILGILTLVAVIPTGAANPGCLRKFIRWCIINIYHVRLLRKLLGITNIGPVPPPVMELSDGGHIENLALLPLFKLRLPRIVVVNGSYLEPGTHYATDLLFALQQAREKLRCSFTGLDGRDVLEDIREKFVEQPEGKQPRCYRFVVHYYAKNGLSDLKVGEGEVMLISPRHPSKGTNDLEESAWNDFSDDVKLNLDEGAWDRGPAVNAHEVDRLTGCCFECCHWSPCNFLCRFGRFPHHSTANQMFTPAMFTAYHREGYRACVEAQADQFLIA
ncbi:uncharacterized protein LOC110239834 [Exaiptasia diaphana]|uniref:PNPLA domain-containing protein n=1 Tax=Exaiptasia diaphana TaxID=2652724 RepID=A0A913X9Q2_EXADI|nr:uncharacterized protein LOC110239834 [Exaiptasia diaphana]KXJ13708.1 hypothetical protein AC249_AIPGENE19251 [Exaiptasia diaphana]